MQFVKLITLNAALLVVGCLCTTSAIAQSAKPARDTVPPKTWTEHWFEHKLVLSRVYYDNNVVVYYDDGMNKAVTWPYHILSDAWAYVNKTYGNMGNPARLFVVLHQGTYGGGHPSPYFDASHDYRNTIDCGLDNWERLDMQQILIPIHEMGHLVNNASHGTKGSPSDILWGDSKFMEIFNYDVLAHIGREKDAQQVYADLQQQYDDFPRPRTQWFKNWFYPIYSKYGKQEVLNKYFQLLSANYPKNKHKRFTRLLNWGEFVHFWSAAAGVSLKEQATIAFGWPAEWDDQLKQAQKEFPQLKYN